MQIDIQARHFSLTDALYSHARRRLHMTLTRFEHRIQRVAVRLSDINGPRGGADKRCHLRIVLAGLPDVVIEDTESNLYVAIDRAIERAGRTLLRKLTRKQSVARHGRAPLMPAQQLVHELN